MSQKGVHTRRPRPPAGGRIDGQGSHTPKESHDRYERELIEQQWAKASEGKAVFVMATWKRSDPKKVRAQLLDALRCVKQCRWRYLVTYWTNQPAAPSNLRLLQPDGTWLVWKDCEDERKIRRGSQVEVEERLLSALNANNLMILLGSGVSFAAKNNDGNQAPSMGDLWDSVRNQTGQDKFDRLLRTFLVQTLKRTSSLFSASAR